MILLDFNLRYLVVGFERLGSEFALYECLFVVISGSFDILVYCLWYLDWAESYFRVVSSRSK